MIGKMIRGTFLVALGLALTLPAGMATAAPDLGPDWVLTGTTKVRRFAPAPTEQITGKGRGKWKVTAVRDRQYFIADETVGQTEERSLSTSRLIRTQIEKSPTTVAIEKVQGAKKSTQAVFEKVSDRSRDRRVEGRAAKTFEVATVEKIRETTTTTAIQNYESLSWEERARKTLRNTYRVKANITFRDPVTRQEFKSQSQWLEKPVDEIAFGSWQKKSLRRKGSAGREQTKVSEIIARRKTEKLLASTLAPATDAPSISTADGASVAFSSGPQIGSSGARISDISGAQRLSGGGSVKARGGAKSQFDALVQVARGGLRLMDESGKGWTVESDGESLAFTPSGGGTVRIAVADQSGEASGVAVRLDAVDIHSARISLAGKFQRGDGKVAKALRTHPEK